MRTKLPTGIEYRYQDKNTGEHVYRISVYCGRDKKPIRQQIRFPRNIPERVRIKAAEKQRALLVAQYERREIVSAQRYTIEEISEKFLNEHIAEKRKQKTLYEYKRLLKIVCEEIGSQQLDQITAMNIQTLYKRLKSKGHSQSMLGHIHDALSSMFSTAIRWQLITVNPCKLIGSPDTSSTSVQKKIKRIKFLSFENAGLLLSRLECEPIKYQLAVQMAIYGGARRSEINGLEWGDFDFANGSIHIQRQSTYIPEIGIYEDDPKTEEGDRVIVPPENLMNLAQKYRDIWEKTKVVWSEENRLSDRLFTKEDGSPIFPDTIANWFRKFLVKIREEQRNELLQEGAAEEDIENLLFPKIRFHDLRHTCGTMRKALGDTLEDVGAYLGHADKTSTMIYVHAMKNSQKLTSEKMASIIQKASNIPNDIPRSNIS